jgi:periplasmic protein TonB
LMTEAGEPITKMGKWDWWVNYETPSIEQPAETSLPDTAPTPKAMQDSTESALLDKWPEPIKLKPPIYPKRAVVAGIESSVWVKIFVNSSGKVTCATIAKNSGIENSGFEEAALISALESKWKPAIQGGKFLAVWISYEIKFRLR